MDNDSDFQSEGNSIIVSLPMQLFNIERGEVQAKIVCKSDKSIIYDISSSLPVKEVEMLPLECSDNHDQLYELVEKYYTAIGKLIGGRESGPFLIRDFAYPPYDTRHWGKGRHLEISNSSGFFEYEAIADYQARNENQINMREGEIYQLIEDLKDGCFLVRSKETRKQGAVPENYLRPK
jgi:hypothetical protein